VSGVTFGLFPAHTWRLDPNISSCKNLKDVHLAEKIATVHTHDSPGPRNCQDLEKINIRGPVREHPLLLVGAQ